MNIFVSQSVSQSVRATVAATRVGRMLIIQGCHSGHFLDFIYVIIDVIGTCMQIFKKIDRRKKPNFFHLKIWCNVSVADCTYMLLFYFVF